MLLQAGRYLGLRLARRATTTPIFGGSYRLVTKMSAEELEKQIQEAQDAVTKQGDTVRSLKASLKDGKAEKASVPGAC